jgi:membrane-bound serine protease (ClpP class)
MLELRGMINPVSERYLVRELDAAKQDAAALVLIELDTPGGLLDATQSVTSAMLTSDTPIAVFVAPAGSRAASAGVFVTMAAHVAAMAPSTRIGAATPISAEGNELPADAREKILNDTVVYARSIAEARARNADWAERSVRDAEVVQAGRALELGVIDLVAADRSELLARIDGMIVEGQSGPITLRTARGPLEARTMSPFESLLMAIADPNIALLFLTLGSLGIYFELANPGAMIPGIAGAIFLLLGFLSLGVLPVSYAGVALLLLGLLLMGAEIFVTSGGVLAVGGVAAFALGSLVMIDDREAPFLEVSRPLIFALTAVLGAFALIAMRGVIAARRRPVAIGGADLIGRIAEVRSPTEVSVLAESWRARGRTGSPLTPGSRVRIVDREGLELTVEPVDDGGSRGSEARDGDATEAQREVTG